MNIRSLVSAFSFVAYVLFHNIKNLFDVCLSFVVLCQEKKVERIHL